jgi:transposase
VARYKDKSFQQGQFISVYFNDQLLSGTFEHTLHHLIENVLDLSIFDARYRNDETGAPAYNPKVLLKVILYAYSRGIVSSRKIARCCEKHVTFMALSNGSRPHFTTISDFISTLDHEIILLFRNVLLICDKEGLIGREMFAIDGCKLPSNASRQWSGTRKDFTRKVEKLEKAIAAMLDKHRETDRQHVGEDEKKHDQQYIEKLTLQVNKFKNWLSDHDDKPGKPIKSNITDNDSAKMATSNGVIQGYDGVATVDNKHQVVVGAEAYGQGQEHDLLKPMIDGARENFKAMGDDDVFKKTSLTADSGFHSKNNMDMLFDEQIDAYVADNQFRKRDPKFYDYGRYKERAKKKGRKGLFATKDFIFPKDLSYCVCPAGKRKVNGQWLLYCIVHNMLKVHRFGPGYA